MSYVSSSRTTTLFRLVVLIASSCVAGCVLADSADSYPFVPIYPLFEPADAGDNSNTNDDLPPPVPPILMFTEVLIDAPGSDPSVAERGEYIEIKNVGEGSADPRRITILLNDLSDPLAGARISVAQPLTKEEEDVFNGLKMIEPQEYFVFVRHEDPTVAPISDVVPLGLIYDFGRYANGPTLPHQTAARRQLALVYRHPGGETQVFDSIRWEGRELRDIDGDGKALAFAEGEAVGVDERFEHPDENDDPQRWCVPDVFVGEVAGTPGGPTTCP